MPPTHTLFKASPRSLDAQLSHQLEANLAAWLQWALLGAGSYRVVTTPQSGVYGADESRLRPVSHPYFPDGQVWEGARKEWVWETGIEADQPPVRPSGVWVDGVFNPASGIGPRAHRYDYPNGRVVFESPISPSSVVRCGHTQRLVQVYTADAEWWRQVQTGSFRSDDPHFLQRGSGVWDPLAESRVQLPAVVVEAVPNVRRRYGLEVGNQVQTVEQDVLVHVLAEDRFQYLWLHDVLTNQKEHRLVAFDANRVAAADAFPLDENGTPRPSGRMYPDLVRPSGEGGFGWRQVRIEDVRSVDQPRTGSVHHCTVRLTVGVEVE